jgi:hypothetical protein
MTTNKDCTESTHPVAGYVPAFEGADGQEDPAPEPVTDGEALPEKEADVIKPAKVPVTVTDPPADGRTGNHV